MLCQTLRLKDCKLWWCVPLIPPEAEAGGAPCCASLIYVNSKSARATWGDPVSKKQNPCMFSNNKQKIGNSQPYGTHVNPSTGEAKTGRQSSKPTCAT